MQRIQLDIVAVTPQAFNPNAYSLILQESGGKRRLTVTIGLAEAQAIAVQLQGISTARPLMYDFACQVMREFSIRIIEVEISKVEGGVFFSKVYCESKTHPYKVAIDARTSDAVALALKSKCPIYASSEVMQRAGLADSSAPDEINAVGVRPLSAMDVSELRRLLRRAIKSENYEQATKIRDEIRRRE